MLVAGTAWGQVVTQILLKHLSCTPDLQLGWECDLDRARFENTDGGGTVTGGRGRWPEEQNWERKVRCEHCWQEPIGLAVEEGSITFSLA